MNTLNYLMVIVFYIIILFVVFMSGFSFGAMHGTVESMQNITYSCVDNRIVIRGDRWRAWKIDSTNRPERCNRVFR